MADIRVRKRKRLRSKDAKALGDAISEDIGVPVFGGDDPVDRAESPDFDLIFVGNEILGIIVGDKPMLSLRGVLKYEPEKRFVTVDMGAVPFIANGADCMGPGIIDADPDIREGDFVWIRDINNRRPLAVGIALRPGTELVLKKPGKAIKTLNSVGDRLWKAGD